MTISDPPTATPAIIPALLLLDDVVPLAVAASTAKEVRLGAVSILAPLVVVGPLPAVGDSVGDASGLGETLCRVLLVGRVVVVVVFVVVGVPCGR